MEQLVAHEQLGALGKSFAFSPDGRLLISPYRNKLELWHIDEGKLLQTVELEKDTFFNGALVTFAADGSQVAAANLRNPILYQWRVTDADELIEQTATRVDESNTLIADLHFAPEGEPLAVGLTNGTINLYPSPRNMTEAVSVQLPAAVDGVTWSADATLIVAMLTDGSLHTWSGVPTEDAQVLATSPHPTAYSLHALQITDNQESLLVALETGAI